MKPSRLSRWAATALLALACQDHRPLTSPPSFLIQDAAHSGGNPHVYWLPPMEAQPTFTGTFSGTLSPVIEISELPNAANATCGAQGIIATFTTSTGPGGEKVGVDVAGQKYTVNWHTKDFPLNVDCNYRIRALISGLSQPLAIADVDVVSSGAALKRVDTGEFVPLLDDRTLAIKLRIEEGAVFYAATGDDACRAGRDCAEAILTGGQDATVLTDQKLAGVFIPANALLSSDQIAVTIEQRTTRPCIPTVELAVPQFDDCYRYLAVPLGGSEDLRSIGRAAAEGEFNPFFQFRNPVTVGMCVEVGSLTVDQARHLDIFRFDQTPPEGMPRVTSLPDAPATFLPCDTGGLGSPGGFGGVLRRSWDVVWHALFGPQTAYASSAMTHLGLGGSSCCFSYFTWGLPADVQINDGNNQTVAPGSTLPTAPSVIVKDSGGGAVAGVTVTFSVAAGNGTITGAVVTTGADGIARVGSWTLPAAGGTYALTGSLTGAGGSPVTFSATACQPGAVDGVLCPGEWDGVTPISFSVSLPEGGTTPGQLFIRNDATNLYFAVRFDRGIRDVGSQVIFEFDGDNNPPQQNGDDVFLFGTDGQFVDDFRTNLPPCAVESAPASCAFRDVDYGGSNDGVGAFRQEGTVLVFEVSHPLNSGDAGHDFALVGGNVIGMNLNVHVAGGGSVFADTYVPGPGFGSFMPLTITSP